MMQNLLVIGNELRFSGKIYPCAVGKSGITTNKKEGDGCTPVGIFPLRECWYRADRLAPPKIKLPLKVIHENDGWCDDPASAEYNRHIIIPSPRAGEGGERSEREGGLLHTAHPPLPNPPPQGGRGYENLWRDDHCYDLIVPIGYNDDPPVAGRGSAIFLHVMHDHGGPTEGCVALAKSDLLELLPQLNTDTLIEIKG